MDISTPFANRLITKNKTNRKKKLNHSSGIRICACLYAQCKVHRAKCSFREFTFKQGFCCFHCFVLLFLCFFVCVCISFPIIIITMSHKNISALSHCVHAKLDGLIHSRGSNARMNEFRMMSNRNNRLVEQPCQMNAFFSHFLDRFGIQMVFQLPFI